MAVNRNAGSGFLPEKIDFYGRQLASIRGSYLGLPEPGVFPDVYSGKVILPVRAVQAAVFGDAR